MSLPSPCTADLAADSIEAGVFAVIGGAALGVATRGFARIHLAGLGLAVSLALPTREAAVARAATTTLMDMIAGAGAIADAAGRQSGQEAENEELLHEESPFSCGGLAVRGYSYVDYSITVEHICQYVRLSVNCLTRQESTARSTPVIIKVPSKSWVLCFAGQLISNELKPFQKVASLRQ